MLSNYLFLKTKQHILIAARSFVKPITINNKDSVRHAENQTAFILIWHSLDEVFGEDDDGVSAGGDRVDDVVDNGLAHHEVSLVDA